MSDRQPGRTERSSDLQELLNSEPIFRKVEYPVPWKLLIGGFLKFISDDYRESWRKRTWWGKLKLALATPLLIIIGIGLLLISPLFALFFAPGLLLIPVVDAMFRLGKYTPEMPDTYKEVEE